MTFLAQLFYRNYQPETFILVADTPAVAMAGAKKLAAQRGGSLDKGWPGTMGHGVGLVEHVPTARDRRKFKAIKVTAKQEAAR